MRNSNYAENMKLEITLKIYETNKLSLKLEQKIMFMKDFPNFFVFGMLLPAIPLVSVGGVAPHRGGVAPHRGGRGIPSWGAWYPIGPRRNFGTEYQNH